MQGRLIFMQHIDLITHLFMDPGLFMAEKSWGLPELGIMRSII